MLALLLSTVLPAGAMLSAAGLGSVSDLEGETDRVCLGVYLKSGCSGAAGAACSAQSDVAAHCPGLWYGPIAMLLTSVCVSLTTAALPWWPRSPACGHCLRGSGTDHWKCAPALTT